MPQEPNKETELQIVEVEKSKTNEEKLQELLERCNLVLEKIQRRKIHKSNGNT